MTVININNYETLCCIGSAKYNEDTIGFTTNGFWVLDGATGLNNKNLVSNQSDAKWYVSWWNKYLYENINKDKSLKAIIKDGIQSIDKEYLNKLKSMEVSKLDKPSSSICIVKIDKDNLEYFILGDCALHIKTKKEVLIIKDKKLCDFDSQVYKEMESLPELYKLTHEQIKASVMDTIISNRLKRNTKDGYWILEFEEEAVDNSIYGNINIDDNMSIMLTSDGFSCISDRYNIIENENLIEEVKKHGVSSIYSKLREFEEEEFSVNKYPRFKVKDDSSCIYLDINK
ncbi:hypothetical protein [Romboutsia sp.]|uniref:hypothetical protein n=1 Tax=Romboutsia sp. TaxID=1965302 RepID=UPI003F2D7981